MCEMAAARAETKTWCGTGGSSASAGERFALHHRSVIHPRSKVAYSGRLGTKHTKNIQSEAILTPPEGLGRGLAANHAESARGS